MSTSQQLELFQGNQDNVNEIENWGTFKDSLREPVHRWFTYPAGFSYKAVSHSIERFGITPNMVVYLTFPVKSENDDRIRVSSSLLLPTS